MMKNNYEIIKHRLKLLWYHGSASTYYGCWSASEEDLLNNYYWVLDKKYQYLDAISTRGLI
tara:strand:+ start:266 stop:448 length:183 start_codon:yes stop_codon:yes gene_type:complete